MQLRLAFAVSTSVRPKILIMDEWLSTGDEEFRERAQTRLRRIIDTTEILVLASHSRRLLEENCTRVIWLKHGAIHLDETPTPALDAYFAK
jgi:lipopolysaccharide transport system ATP-binding protein